MHQDALSHKFCGTGVPDFVIENSTKSIFTSFPMPLNKFNSSWSNHPSRVECDSINNNNFVMYYVAFE